MKRRTFLGTSTAVGLAGAAAAAQTANQYIELSFNNLTRGTDQSGRLMAFLENEHLPMTKRLGIGPVGYFGLREAPESARAAAQKRGVALPEVGTSIITLTAYDSWSAFEAKQAAQRADKKWTEAVDALIAQPPAYDRMESWLLRAFDGLPKIEVPPPDSNRKPRIFDLRNAETPNLGAQARKIEMWNKGEIQIFRTCRLNPLLFGETLYGSRMPNFWFMVWYDGPEAREAAWDAFRKDPDWARMQKDPRYKGATTPRIIDTYLQPLGFSPIR
jgi:hypothetical protein